MDVRCRTEAVITSHPHLSSLQRATFSILQSSILPSFFFQVGKSATRSQLASIKVHVQHGNKASNFVCIYPRRFLPLCFLSFHSYTSRPLHLFFYLLTISPSQNLAFAHSHTLVYMHV